MSQPPVNHLEASLLERPGDHPDPPVVPVEADLGQEHPNGPGGCGVLGGHQTAAASTYSPNSRFITPTISPKVA